MKPEKPELRVLYDEYVNCTRCNISEMRKSVVFGSGSRDADIMFIADTPTPTDERMGHHNNTDIRWLIRVFRHAIGKASMPVRAAADLFFDKTFMTTAVMCCPRYPKGDLAGQAKEPSWAHVKACRDRLLSTIYEVDPLIIIAAGAFSLQALTGRNSKLPMRSGKLSEMFTVEVPGELGTVYYSAIPAPDPHIAERRGDYDDPNGRVASLSAAISGAWELASYLNNEDRGDIKNVLP